jgi:hypothetical protein
MRKLTPRSRAAGLAVGTGVGLVSGVVPLAFTLSTALAHWSLREVPVWTFLLIYPAIGAALGYALSVSAASVRSGPDSAAGQSSPERSRMSPQRAVAWGLAGGCVLAFFATALDVAWRGWRAVGGPAILNLLVLPYFGVLIAFKLTRKPGEQRALPRLRLNLAMLMFLIGYLALFLGVAVEGYRIGGAAERYHAQSWSAAFQADLFRGFARKNSMEVPLRLANARQLRAGAIPDGITDLQKTFLKSLESAKPDYRKYRFGLIADGEELQGRTAEANITTYAKLINYYEALAAKYAQAEKHPWEPVAPDPPHP